ncbi:MAG: hypothetical protein ACREKH_04695, partial [Candidatus Rokuibacteriota bacterium]
QWSEPGEPPLEGVLSDGEVRQSFWELASVGFPLGEIEVADEAADAGFDQRPVGSLSREQVEYFRASQRWQFFELATRAALRGNRGAWESLERRYADLIDRFESRSEGA